MKTLTISKSDYMLYLKHPSFIWLKKYDSDRLPKIDENLQAMFDAGHEFEKYAEKKFSNICRIGFKDFFEYQTMPKRTKDAIAAGKPVISQGGFEHDGLTCIVDILERCDDGTYNLHEIKSGTRVKDDYIYDLAFQKHVLTGCGIKIKNIFVIYADTSYIRDGNIDASKFTKIEKVTNKVEELNDFTVKNIKIAREIIDCGLRKPPSFLPSLVGCIGNITEAIEVYRNVQGLPAYSIYDLARPNAKRLALFEDANYKFISDIPDDLECLIDKQKNQIMVTKSDSTKIEKNQIEKFIKEFKYPIYFLDYETVGNLIPPFDGIKPYQQVPFQYSLHIQEKEGGEVIHKEYIHRENSNPTKKLTEQLLKDIKNDEGSVVVWYQVFEKKCNTTLAHMFPEHQEELENINNRILDLMIPFKNDWVVNKDFYGSASIKKVLPALCSDIELGYSNMNIGDGLTAQRVWSDTFIKDFSKKTQKEKETVISDLIEYCKLDTFAMVKIFEYLKNLI